MLERHSSGFASGNLRSRLKPGEPCLPHVNTTARNAFDEFHHIRYTDASTKPIIHCPKQKCTKGQRDPLGRNILHFILVYIGHNLLLQLSKINSVHKHAARFSCSCSSLEEHSNQQIPYECLADRLYWLTRLCRHSSQAKVVFVSYLLPDGL